MTHGCLCPDKVDDYAMGMCLFWFCFDTACGAMIFAVATGTTISSSLGRQYRPVLSLSFLDVDGLNIASISARHCLQWKYKKMKASYDKAEDVMSVLCNPPVGAFHFDISKTSLNLRNPDIIGFPLLFLSNLSGC